MHAHRPGARGLQGHVGLRPERREARRLADVRKPTNREGLLHAVRRLISLPATRQPAERKEVGMVKRDGYVIRKLLFITEPGISVPGLLFEPAQVKAGQLTLWIHGDGKHADAGAGGAIEARVRQGERILALDLRGMGETSPATSAKGPGPFGADQKDAFLALHLNRPLLGQRVHDLLSVMDALEKDAKDGFRLVGVGSGGPIVLHAAALDPRCKQTELERCITSWTAVASQPLSNNQLTNVVPGVLRVYDLPNLAAILPPGSLRITNPVDPSGQPASAK